MTAVKFPSIVSGQGFSMSESYDRANVYKSRTENLNLSFKEEQCLKRILNELESKYPGGFHELSNDVCRDLLEELHTQVDERCRTKLDQAEFKKVSKWSLYSNSRAKGKLCALKSFLDQATTIDLAKFSMQELRTMRNELRGAVIPLTGETDKTIEISDDVGMMGHLTIKQTSLYGQSQVSMQYPDCIPCVRSKFSLEDLLRELDLELETRFLKENYGANPPIKELGDLEQRHKTIMTFKNNVMDYVSQDEKEHIGEPSKRSVSDKMQSKITSTMEILEEAWKLQMSSFQFYVYELDAAPIGMMLLHDHYHDWMDINADNKHYQYEHQTYEHDLHINLLVVHPGSEDAGDGLIEFAVDRSVQLGRQGMLSCPMPSDKDAKQAYMAMGFQEIGRDRMRLDPRISDKWEQNEDGQWKLKTHENKRYMSAAFAACAK